MRAGGAAARTGLERLVGEGRATFSGAAAAPLGGRDLAWLGADAAGVALVLDVRGIISGQCVLLLAERAARRWCAALGLPEVAALGLREESALLEVANIVVSWWLGGASGLLGGPAVPGVPEARYGALSALLAELEVGVGPGWLGRCAASADEGARGHLLLLVDEANAALVRECLGA
jgi:hypothetical protein